VNRRHFMKHMATAAALAPTLQFMDHLKAHAAQVQKNKKACILMWMGGGPPTIDIWDLKPGSKNGGEFAPIDTAAPGVQITEHLPKVAKVMNNLSLVRSMSTREADHGRGRYFMHTGFVPNPTVVHATFGSVVSHELGSIRKDLEIPAFVSVGGGSGSPGFMGTANAPFVVNSSGQVNNVDMGVGEDRLKQRLAMLKGIEDNFIRTKRGELPNDHRNVYGKAVNLMTSEQMKAFRVDEEDPAEIARYGDNNFGRGLLMARRLIETGVPFVEVNHPSSFDLHGNVFESLRTNHLPITDNALG